MLTQQQITQYERQGLLVLPSFFSADEIGSLMADMPRIVAMDRPEVAKSAECETRTALALHRYSDAFQRFMHNPKLIALARQLLGGDIYCHQYKIVCKDPMGTLDFPWHQDFANWHDLDGMPEPLALNISIYLDPVTEFNGPVAFIPGSHHRGRIPSLVETPAGLENMTTLARLNRGAIEDMVNEYGLVAPKGPAGTIAIFHGLTAHASTPNISPWTRHILYFTANRVSNAIRKPTRPDYVAHRDFAPLEPETALA
ncbi:MAG: phytanoyl-CoA dioxygenase family protein [Sulfuricaulis sp.]|nr:phytanoyl-CoA dioxygenase family protein [Sulfuricaulis sp.]